jgi:hypothetical protein
MGDMGAAGGGRDQPPDHRGDDQRHLVSAQPVLV